MLEWSFWKLITTLKVACVPSEKRQSKSFCYYGHEISTFKTLGKD
jgi:hypothetical protein